MGNDYLRLNIIVCCVNPSSENLINKLFPEIVEENKRMLEKKDDKIRYTARIFKGRTTSEGNLNRIREYISNNYDHIQNGKKEFPKNVLLYFSDENQSLRQNLHSWIIIANAINILPELKLPFIIFLSYGDIQEIRNNVQRTDAFRNFKDKRKIMILRLLRNEINAQNGEFENNANQELNYSKILSHLWRLVLILNQKPFKLSKNPHANLNRIEEPIPTVSINILLTGFSRKGKSTFINMMFDKMITLENPSFIPVTSEIIEFLLPSRPGENGIVNGGLKVFDVPGLIEGTTENMDHILDLVNKSIKNQEYNYDVINYILFFLSPAPNFQNTEKFLKKLEQAGIKVIFIINRDRPRNDGRPNTTKETLIAHLRSLGLNNLIKNDGNNILEVDLINGVQGRTNEIFRYINDDLIQNNRFNNNEINLIRQLPDQEFYNYLHHNYQFFSKISSTEDLIQRGKNRADLIIAGTIPMIIAAGFSPLPFMDLPIFLILIALMLVGIFKAFGCHIEIQIFRNFFNQFVMRNGMRNRNNDNNEEGLISRIINWLSRNFVNSYNENTKFIIKKIIEEFKIRISILTVSNALKCVPGGFAIAGIINAIINSPLLYKIGEDAKDFLSMKIRDSGGRQNIMNIIEGYRDSISLINNLRNKNDWSRKIQIFNN